MSFADLADAAARHNTHLIEEKYTQMTDAEINIRVREQMTAAFQNVADALSEIAEVAKKNPFKNIAKKIEVNQPSKKTGVRSTNGLVQYESGTGGPGEESIHERIARGRYWKSMGKKIRKGSRIA